MAESNSASDSQALLQSMLDRLKLYTHSERSTHSQGGGVSGAGLFRFGGSTDPTQQGQDLPFSWTKADRQQTQPCLAARQTLAPFSKQLSPGLAGWKTQNTGAAQFGSGAQTCHGHPTSESFSSDGAGWSEEEVPRWERRQLMFTTVKGKSDRNTSITQPPSKADLQPLASHTPSLVQGELAYHSQDERASEGMEDEKTEATSIYEKITKRTSKRRWVDIKTKKWSMKVKERWKERGRTQERKREETGNNDGPKDDGDMVSNQSDEMFQQPPVTEGITECPPSPLTNVSEFSLGSFNLMEEICSGEEWRRFLQPISIGQSETSSGWTMQDQGKSRDTMSPDRIHHSHEPENTGNQWDHAFNAGLNMVQTFSEHLTEPMQSVDNSFNQPQATEQNLNQPQSLNQSQTEEFGLKQAQTSQQTNKQSQPFHWTRQENNQSVRFEGIPDQSQLTDINQNLPEKSRMENMLPLLDLSFLKPAGSSSANTRVSLRRKRGHGTEEKEESRPEKTTVEEEQCNSKMNPPSLSSASSLSSLPYSISQDSESSTSMETVIKKRRVEETRRVHFAKDVEILPTCNAFEDVEDDWSEEPLPHPSLPSWILALRKKTKRKSWKP